MSYLDHKICKRCIYNAETGGITFDEHGVCNYCKMIDQLQEEYKTGTSQGEAAFAKIVEDIKRAGKGKKYDVAIGVSGGTDSSFLVYLAVKKWGLRPLAVHYDNTWNSAIATQNIYKVLNKLNVDLHTYVVNNKEIDDIFKAFFYAGLAELDAATDMAAPEVIFRACAKYGIKYVLDGHSFRAEGVSPLSAMYCDGKYIKSVHDRFGSMKMKTYPNMYFGSFMKWMLIYRIKRIRPFWYIPYTKQDARDFLQKEFDWVYYSGHHLENRLSAFLHSYYDPKKFGLDQRNNSLSALVRSGEMSQNKALEEYMTEPHIEPELVEFFIKRMGITQEEFEAVMKGEKRNYQAFSSYKKLFEKLRPFFYVMYRLQRVPKSFYLKYCFPAKALS